MRSEADAAFQVGDPVRVTQNIEGIVPAGCEGTVVALWLIGRGPKTCDTDPILYRVCHGDPLTPGAWTWDVWCEAGSLTSRAQDAQGQRQEEGR